MLASARVGRLGAPKCTRLTGVAGLLPVSVNADIAAIRRAAPVKTEKKVLTVEGTRSAGPVVRTEAMPPSGRA